MNRPLLLAVAVLAAGAAAAGFAASGSAQKKGGPAVTTITLVGRGGSFHFVDNAPYQRNPEEQPPSAGDTFVGTQGFFLRGRRAATLYFQCTVVSGGSPGASHCTGTYALRGGTIAASAVFRGQRPVTRIAIVGGTGAYEGARGSVISRDRRGTTIDTIRLLR